MTELELLQQISDNSQALIELGSFISGLACVLITAITWKG